MSEFKEHINHIKGEKVYLEENLCKLQEILREGGYTEDYIEHYLDLAKRIYSLGMGVLVNIDSDEPVVPTQDTSLSFQFEFSKNCSNIDRNIPKSRN